jgi:hypothetical protein
MPNPKAVAKDEEKLFIARLRVTREFEVSALGSLEI